MKSSIILFTLIFFFPTNTAKADELLKVMSNYWSYELENQKSYNDCSCPNKDYSDQENYENEIGSPDENANGEHYSWDNLYLEPAYPEVIYSN